MFQGNSSPPRQAPTTRLEPAAVATPAGTQVLTANGIHEVVKLPLEDVQRVLQDLLVVGSAQGDQVELLLHSTADGRQNKLCICKAHALPSCGSCGLPSSTLQEEPVLRPMTFCYVHHTPYLALLPFSSSADQTLVSCSLEVQRSISCNSLVPAALALPHLLPYQPSPSTFFPPERFYNISSIYGPSRWTLSLFVSSHMVLPSEDVLASELNHSITEVTDATAAA